jgi:hypothetical protein
VNPRFTGRAVLRTYSAALIRALKSVVERSKIGES